MEMMAYFLVAVILLLIIVKVFAWPLKLLVKLILNGAFGVILLLIVNAIGHNFGITLGINIVTALIAGICGIPGVAFLIVFKLFL